MAFNPSSDLNSIQSLLMEDEKILKLLNLTGGSTLEKAKRIIKRSQWDGLATNEKRICIFFVPDRKSKNIAFMESVIEIDVHVPISEDFKAWEIQERIKVLLHKKKTNKRYTYFNGQLGELPTMDGFFCCGTRFDFSRLI